ncbi:MAG: putative N-acetyltransferase, GCN5-related [Symbiobacteriaceae bacterium]|nr:putative N-acetyltransferase, GCN5-related [Symbiobacteriaceae bacterium]
MLGSMEPWISYRVDGPAWERLLAAVPPGEEALVALDGDDRVTGYAQFSYKGAFCLSGYIRTLAVDPGRHGGGLGRQLLAHVEELVFARGPNVFLLCSARNEKAQAFYRAVGYEQVGCLNAYVLPGEDELLFRKTRGPIRKQ